MMIYDPYARYIHHTGPVTPLPSLSLFFERSSGTAIERIGRLITVDFTEYLLRHFGGHRMIQEAMALTVAERLFKNSHFLGRPDRAASIARSELKYSYTYTKYDTDFRYRHFYFSEHLLKLCPFRQQQAIQ